MNYDKHKETLVEDGPSRYTGELLHADLTGKIIGAAMEVHSVLKPGLDEKLYENALICECGLRGISSQQQAAFPVQYKGVPLGTLIPDLIVADKVIVDAKVVTAFNDTHLAQILGYLAITGLRVGLLINFKHAKLQWRRIQR